MQWIRSILRIALWATLGAVAGRIVGDIRTRGRDGREPTIDLATASIRPQQVIPGVVAAMRVREWPWSVLHLPGWLAAFLVNFVIAAFAAEVLPLRRMLGGDAPDEDVWSIEPDAASDTEHGT